VGWFLLKGDEHESINADTVLITKARGSPASTARNSDSSCPERRKSETAAGKFKDCLKVEESSAVEAGKEIKVYAHDVGKVKDSALLLIKYGKKP